MLYKIVSVLEKDRNTPKKDAQYRIGREGIIHFLEKNKPLIFAYQNNKELEGKALATSNVVAVFKDKNKFCIDTKNSMYILEQSNN